MKRTKIVATIGPSSSSKDILNEMISSGMNVCRINFSHGSYSDHARVIQSVRELNEELNTNVAILADLQGPKIRTGEMQEGGVELEVGASINSNRRCCWLQRFIFNKLCEVARRCSARRVNPFR